MRTRVSEVLNRKRALSIGIIRRLLRQGCEFRIGGEAGVDLFHAGDHRRRRGEVVGGVAVLRPREIVFVVAVDDQAVAALRCFFCRNSTNERPQ